MAYATLLRVIVCCHVLSFACAVVPLAKKTKLCGDEACTEKLFEGKFHRSMTANDDRFLASKENDLVSIYAIKFSDRTDLMEGALLREPERRGSFFSSHITLDGYVDFLKSAVESNKTLFMISTDPRDHPGKKLVGLKSAYPELVRDYEVNSKRLAAEGVIPQAVPLNLEALDAKVIEALNHMGHGHSHAHGHSHDGIGHGHAHSHEPPPVATQATLKQAPIAAANNDGPDAAVQSAQQKAHSVPTPIAQGDPQLAAANLGAAQNTQNVNKVSAVNIEPTSALPSAEQTPPAGTPIGSTGPELTTSSSGTPSNTQDLNNPTVVRQNVLVQSEEEDEIDRFIREEMEGMAKAAADAAVQGSNKSLLPQQSAAGVAAQGASVDPKITPSSGQLPSNPNAQQHQPQKIFVLGAEGTVEQLSPQSQTVRPASVPMSQIPFDSAAQQLVAPAVPQQPLVRPSSVPVSEIPVADPSEIVQQQQPPQTVVQKQQPSQTVIPQQQQQPSQTIIQQQQQPSKTVAQQQQQHLQINDQRQQQPPQTAAQQQQQPSETVSQQQQQPRQINDQQQPSQTIIQQQQHSSQIVAQQQRQQQPHQMNDQQQPSQTIAQQQQQPSKTVAQQQQQHSQINDQQQPSQTVAQQQPSQTVAQQQKQPNTLVSDAAKVQTAETLTAGGLSFGIGAQVPPNLGATTGGATVRTDLGHTDTVETQVHTSANNVANQGAQAGVSEQPVSDPVGSLPAQPTGQNPSGEIPVSNPAVDVPQLPTNSDLNIANHLPAGSAPVDVPPSQSAFDYASSPQGPNIATEHLHSTLLANQDATTYRESNNDTAKATVLEREDSHINETDTVETSVKTDQGDGHQAMPEAGADFPSGDNVAAHAQDSAQMAAKPEVKEVRTEIMEEDGLGYCIKGDCNRMFVDPEKNSDAASAQPQPGISVNPTTPLPTGQITAPSSVVQPPAESAKEETHHQPSSQEPSIQPADGLPSQMGQDRSSPQGQQVVSQSPPAESVTQAPQNIQPAPSGLGKWLSRVIALFRYALPPSLAGIDDAGIVVSLMVPICLAIHLLRTFLLSDNSEQDAFDRRTLHDALTAVRERDEQIKMLRVDAEKGRGAASREKDEKIEQLELDLGQRKLELQQLRNRCDHLEEMNERVRREADEAKKLADNERHNAAALADENKQLERANQMLSDQISEMQSTMESAREKNEKLGDDLADKNALITRLETETRSRAVEIKKLTDQLQTAMDEGAMLRERVDALQGETVQLSEMIDELNKAKELASAQHSPTGGSAPHADDHAAHESGGSAGWSDIGDFDIETSISEEKKLPPISGQPRKQKECTPPKSNPGDIMEVARLRAQLKRVEADLDQARLSLQKEENMREHLTRKVELAELEANERKKETEAKEAERVDTHNQCKKMLAMVEERDAKIRHSEGLTDKLRDEVNKWQAEVRHLEEQNKVVESKLNEAEHELKRLRAENNRLETRHFHEMRECKHTISSLQQSLEAAQLAAMPKLPDGGNLLNLSSNGSSDREFAAPIVSHLGPPPLPLIRPLWGDDEPPEVFSGGESSVMSGSGGALRRTASPDGLPAVAMKKGIRSRRSHRELRDASPDGVGMQYAARPKKEGRRMRSRSHGRHPYSPSGAYMPQMGGVPPAFPDLFNDPPLSKRNSKSGNLYYSSGGSNGGLSPPPEMALLSGVPPPGLTIKKPTVTSRPKSVTEQMARHQN